jgi:hypothetical protein
MGHFLGAHVSMSAALPPNMKTTTGLRRIEKSTTNDLHRSRYYYQINLGKAFCKSTENVQAAVRAAPGAVQPIQKAQWGKSGHHVAEDAQDSGEGSDDDTTHSASGSESDTETETEQQDPSPAKNSKKGKRKQKGASARSRNQKKKKIRKQNKAKAVAGDVRATTASAAAAASAPGPSMSSMADIAQKEVLKAIGNALLQKVEQR